MNDILDELVAKGVSSEVIVKVAKLIADAEQSQDRRSKNAERMRSVRARAHTSMHTETQTSTYLTSLPSSITSLEKEERLESVALGPLPKYPPSFEEFYRQYPRHAGKRDALKVWSRVTKSEVTNEDLIAGAMRYAADPNRDDSFTKHCATWLNKGCWSDGPLPPRGGQNGRKETPIEQAQRLADEWTRRELAAGIHGEADDAGSNRRRG